MPANTPRLALPYPIPDDTVDVPRDVQALANKLDGFTWLTPPVPLERARAQRNAALNIANDTLTAISFDAAVAHVGNTAGMWVAGTPTRLIAVTAGVYHFHGQTEFGINATGVRGISVQKNNQGTQRIAQEWRGAAPGTGYGTRMHVTGWDYLNANDYLEMLVIQNSGVALPLTVGSAYSTTFGMLRLGG